MFLSIPFKQYSFVSASPGTILFGNVELKRGRLEYKKESLFTVDYYKITEFLELLQILGRNIVIRDDEGAVPFEKDMEMNTGEKIRVKNSTITRTSSSSPENPVTLLFDHFMFINFVNAVKEITYFIVNPSKLQYEAMKRFEVSPLENEEEKLEAACYTPNSTEAEKFMMESFLITHKELLIFCIELDKLA